MTFAEVLAALAGPITALIELIASDHYDAEAERQALLNLERSIADLRMKRILNKKQ